jgi:hypothetical protein
MNLIDSIGRLTMICNISKVNMSNDSSLQQNGAIQHIIREEHNMFGANLS